jgi:hypothetical protein
MIRPGALGGAADRSDVRQVGAGEGVRILILHLADQVASIRPIFNVFAALGAALRANRPIASRDDVVTTWGGKTGF